MFRTWSPESIGDQRIGTEQVCAEHACVPSVWEQSTCRLLPQDLNAVETAWRELRARLDDTMPTGRETRATFLARLRRAVAWVNVHRGEYFQELCTNQKERAKDVIAAKGVRTKH